MSVQDDIEKERRRQIDKGFDYAHDDKHTDGQLVRGAVAYALNNDYFWPWNDWPYNHAKTERERLIVSIAMLVAEVERLDRI